MLLERESKAIVQRALALSSAEHIEVSLSTEDSSLTRFAGNQIHQNVAQMDATASVRVSDGKSYGFGKTNDLSDKGLKALVDQALVSARAMPESADFLLPLAPLVSPKLNSYSLATAEFGPFQRSAAVSSICKMAQDKGVTASGAFKVEVSSETVANSQGLLCYHPNTSAELMVVATSADSTGYAGQLEVNAEAINAEKLAVEAIDKAVGGRNPRALEGGIYEVVLEEYAVSDMMDYLGHLGFGALAFQEGRSFMSGKIGAHVMSSNITIWDDGLDPSGIMRPFDYEGHPKQKVNLITEGVARSPVYDRRTATKLGGASTGHALPGLPAGGPIPMNIFLGGGEASKEELVASVEQGILITRFWYTRVVHPLTVLMTGMTRDGVFLIEKGEVVGPVKNLRFTQSYLDALKHVDLVGRETKLVRDFMSTNRVPALKIGGWHFTGVTEY